MPRIRGRGHGRVLGVSAWRWLVRWTPFLAACCIVTLALVACNAGFSPTRIRVVGVRLPAGLAPGLPAQPGLPGQDLFGMVADSLRQGRIPEPLLHPEVVVVLEVQNSNPVGATVTALHGVFVCDGQPVGTIRLPQGARVTIAPRAATRMDGVVVVDGPNAVGVMLGRLGAGTPECRLQGEATLDTPFGDKRFPLPDTPVNPTRGL